MSEPIGTDARISLADLAGEFHELAPWQREMIDRIEAETGAKVIVAGTNDAQTLNYSVHGSLADCIVIDDPWSIREAAVANFLGMNDQPGAALRVAEPDWPALKSSEEFQIEQINAMRGVRYVAPPVNRAARRAQEARDRRRR